MIADTPTTVARHVEAANRLLRELEQQAAVATDVLTAGDGMDFLAAVEKRQGLFAQLETVVGALAQERVRLGGRADDRSAQADALIGQVARVAAGVLQSHDRLVEQVRVERDRLAVAVRRTKQPDTIANQYAATSHAARHQTLSVTG
jgi:hypothetical protein